MEQVGWSPMTLYLLDSGGVLFANVTEETPFFARLGERYGVDPAEVRAHYEEADARFEVGETTAVAVVLLALEQAGAPTMAAVEGRQIRQLYRESVRLHQEVFDLLARRHRGAGRPQVALANNEARDWEMLKDRHFGHLALFDVIASSWAVGAVKPTNGYFEAVLDRCRGEVATTVLIDDDAGNVAAARELGLQAVLYDGPASLVAALEGEA